MTWIAGTRHDQSLRLATIYNDPVPTLAFISSMKCCFMLWTIALRFKASRQLNHGTQTIPNPKDIQQKPTHDTLPGLLIALQPIWNLEPIQLVFRAPIWHGCIASNLQFAIPLSLNANRNMPKMLWGLAGVERPPVTCVNLFIPSYPTHPLNF